MVSVPTVTPAFPTRPPARLTPAAPFPINALASAPVDRIADANAVIPNRLSLSLSTAHAPSFGAAYEAKMSKLAGGPSYAPAIHYLRRGEDALKARLDAIANATSSILMTTYAIEADEVTATVLQALTKRAREGISVIVKSDAFPTTFVQGENSPKENQHMFELLRELESAGGVVVFYGTEADQRINTGCGDHLKLLLTDGKAAIAGGRNLSSDYFIDWRDLDGAFGGSVATQLGHKALGLARYADPTSLNRWSGNDADLIRQRMATILGQVQRDLSEADRAATRTGIPCWVMAWDPTHDHREHSPSENENAISQALIESFGRAKREIIVSSNYVNGNANVHAAIVQAAQRGVRVTIVTTSEALSTRSLLPYLAAETRYAELRRLGGRVMEVTQQIDHAKMYAIDCDPPPPHSTAAQKRAWQRGVAAFGSYNLEHAADNHLAEQLVFSRDQSQCDFVRAALMSDIDEICTEYTGPKKRGVFEQLWFWLLTLLALMSEDLF